MDLGSVAAWTFAVLVALVIAFQVALALGAPWGEYAMAGRFPGRYPPAMRLGAVIQAVVLGLVAVVVLSAAGIVAPELAAAAPWLIWVVVAMSAIGTVLNAISPSAGERRIWVPVTVALFATSLVVAIA